MSKINRSLVRRIMQSNNAPRQFSWGPFASDGRMSEDREADRDGNYMSVNNMKDIHEISGRLTQMIGVGAEMEDWVEDKISAARQLLSDLDRYYSNGQESDKKAANKPPQFYAKLQKTIPKRWNGTGGIQLKPNDKIRAKRDTSVNFPVGSGRGNSGYVTKGTVLQVGSQGTSRGDVFAEVVSGKCYAWVYGSEYDLNATGVRETSRPSLSWQGGHSTQHPYDLGTVDPNVWDVLSKRAATQITKKASVNEKLMDRAAMLLQYADEREARKTLEKEGVNRQDAYLAVKAGKMLNETRQKNMRRNAVKRVAGKVLK